jgi:hypothetical protein
MAEARTWRLALGPRPGERAHRAFYAVARHGLGLAPGAAERLWRKLPATLVLAPMEQARREELAGKLRATGMQVSLEPLPAEHPACARHPMLAAGDACPRCETGLACAACLELDGEPACASCAARTRRRARFRRWRIAFLTTILIVVAGTAYLDRRRVLGWRVPLTVGIYPINADGSEAVARYIGSLRAEDFADVGAFLAREGLRHGVRTRPIVEVKVGPPVSALPPRPPDDRSAWRIALWSLQLRAWVFRVARAARLPSAKVRIFALYHTPRPGLALEHSLGLEKGHIGVAHLLAGRDEAAANAVVIAHELLHTAGATDKYDERGLPVHPDGYADPGRDPRWPQLRAEIMGGRIPISASDARPAETLEACVVGERTAREIGWRRP